MEYLRHPSQYRAKLRFNVNEIPADCFIKPGYIARQVSAYFEDSLTDHADIVHQPDVYALAAYLGRQFGCTHILDIGCGRALKLIKLYPKFEVVGVDFGSNIDYCRAHYHFGQWLHADLEKHQSQLLAPEILKNTLVVCSDVIEHLVNPSGLLLTLRHCLEHASVAILSTPERDLVRGKNDMGPPANSAHVREWSLPELTRLIEAFSLETAFIGLTCNNNRDLDKKTILAIFHGSRMYRRDTAGSTDFRVVAFMTAYNEADIIFHSVSRLIQQGVDVYLIDNWSTDGTVAAVESLLGKGLIGIEHFPVDGNTGTYDWSKLLARIEELARTITADWFIHHDVDEIRESPWPELRLRDALNYVDHAGFNAVDHTVIDFRAIDNGFSLGDDFGTYFTKWEFGRRPGHFQQIKAWKNLGQRLTLADTGGHDVDFYGRRIFPYKFLLRHYPVRSQKHGEKKVLAERKARFNPEERVNKGWHTQYDHIEIGHNFLRSPESLSSFESSRFYQEFLVERISGIGIVRQTTQIPINGLIAKLSGSLIRMWGRLWP